MYKEKFSDTECKAQNRRELPIHDSVTSLEEKEADTEDENDYEPKESYESLNGTTRTITLQTLMNANILQPGKSLMTIDYLGQKFVGDLMTDGKIKSQETETIFLTPSAWAMHCKRIINPEKKSGCGWASVKYKGKKLDAYKNSWLRKCALQKDITIYDLESDIDKKPDFLTPVLKRTVCPYNTVANRDLPHDGNMLIKAVSFDSMGKVQPFLVTFHSSALLLADFHCHLSMKEVCGYFGGRWDINTHTLTIYKTYPCRRTRFDIHKAAEEEQRIKEKILKDQLLLVGWYHSHPKFQAEPSLRDCDAQLEFEIRMRGSSDVTYTPCISTIISPYYEENPTLSSVVQSIWVMPPIETKHVLEYGRPMIMKYSVFTDKELPEYIRWELQACAEYYALFRNDFVRFNSIFNQDLTFIEKLKGSLHPNFPENPNNTSMWNMICEVLECNKENEFIPPKVVETIDRNDLNTIVKVPYSNESADEIKALLNIQSHQIEINECDKKGNEIKVLSLQEQLCLPSGLNMNPVRTFAPLATPSPLGAGNISTLVAGNLVSNICSDVLIPPPPPTKAGSNISKVSSTLPIEELPLRDSPVTVLSGPASPVKSTQLLTQSSSSPPKPETSLRSQNPPSPRSFSNILQDSSDIDKNVMQTQSALFSSTTNDLVTASLSQLAGQFAPNFLQTDLSSLLQQRLSDKNFTNSNLNQLISENSGEQKNNSSELVLSGYSKNFNLQGQESSLINQGILGNPKNKEDSSRHSLPFIFSPNAANLNRSKLMRELEIIKNDPLKINELIRSPEYAAILLHQAEALGATTLGTLGLGSELNFLTGNNFDSKETSSQAADYKNVVQASKIFGYEPSVQQAKSDDLNTLIQQQMGAVAAAALVNVSLSSSLGSSKKQKLLDTHSHTDYSSLLQTYSKIFETGDSFQDSSTEGRTTINSQNELTTLLPTGSKTESSIFEPKQKVNDMQIQQKQNDNQIRLPNSLNYQQCKTPSDISALFAASSAVTNLTITNKLAGANSNATNVSALTDSSMYYNAFSQDKMQDYSYFQQQHAKQDNNFFISPAAMMKIQKDSLSAMMMKPPKSSSIVSSLPRSRESSTSPALGSLTPTPNSCNSANLKYNFNAMDLAVSSLQPSMSISVPLETVSTAASLRRPSNTPPVDLSSFYNGTQSSSSTGPMKKRMEYSSIAELAAPPPTKFCKVNADTLSNI